MIGRDVALVFPGQGAQQPRMGAGLYSVDPEFARVMDEFFAASGNAGKQLRDDWLAHRPGPELDDCSCAQPLLFAVGCALALAVMARGLRPAVLVGHSVGELAAAAVAGVFTIADGGRVMSARITAMSATLPGGMLAVAAGVDQVCELLGDLLDGARSSASVAIAAINTPRQTVLSGATAGLADVEHRLSAEGVVWQRVRARQAFHSPLCAAAGRAFGESLRGIELRIPAITVRSTCTGRDVTDAEAMTPEFWSNQLAKPVLFWPAVDEMLNTRELLFLEAGPGGSCSAILRRHRAMRSGRSAILPLLPAGSDGDDRSVFNESVAKALEIVESNRSPNSTH